LCMKKIYIIFVPFKRKGNSVPHDAVAKWPAKKMMR
jgi:hypothetical protein